MRQAQQLGKLTVGEAQTAHKAGVEISIASAIRGTNNSLHLSAKRANSWVSLRVLCRISFASDSLNSLTGVS